MTDTTREPITQNSLLKNVSRHILLLLCIAVSLQTTQADYKQFVRQKMKRGWANQKMKETKMAWDTCEAKIISNFYAQENSSWYNKLWYYQES